MKGIRKNITGHEYGMLTVVCYTGGMRGNHYEVECRCQCGKTVKTSTSNLIQRKRISCGCHRIKHGCSFTAEYASWKGMKARCLNEKNVRYPHYGGRGIIICEEWKNSFDKFLADVGKKPTKNHSIDRIDVNGNYEPLNCEWALPDKQSRNRRKAPSKTGERGISIMPNGNDYKAGIFVKNKRIHIGVYSSLQEAKQARAEAECRFWGEYAG